jgi:hypothetical protein
VKDAWRAKQEAVASKDRMKSLWEGVSWRALLAGSDVADLLFQSAVAAYDRIPRPGPRPFSYGRLNHQGTLSAQVTGRSPVDRGKGGTKRSVAVEATGIPVGVIAAPANRRDDGRWRPPFPPRARGRRIAAQCVTTSTAWRPWPHRPVDRPGHRSARLGLVGGWAPTGGTGAGWRAVAGRRRRR